MKALEIKILFFLFFLPFVVLAGPVNDTCAGAISIIPDAVCTPVNSNLAGATNSYSSPKYKDVWFKFIPKTTINYIHVTGGGNLKVAVQLYEGVCGGTFLAKATFTSSDSTITATYSGLDTTKTYYYRVYHNSATVVPSVTTFTTCVENGILNDNCSGAYVLTAGNPGDACIETLGKVDGASASVPSPASVCGSAAQANEDVWYKFKATASKHVLTLTGVGGFKPVFEILSAAGTCSGPSMDCKSSSTGGATISLQKSGFSINQWYYLRIYNSGTEITTTPYFNVCVTTPPANDTCSGAISVIPDVACTPVNGDLARATPSYPAETYKDVWFKFIPKTPIHYIHVNGGGNLKASIQLYTGTCGSTLASYNSLSAVKSTDSNITAAYSGLDTTKTYYYRVFHDNTSATASVTTFTTCIENGILNDDCSGAYVLAPGYPGDVCTETLGKVDGASASVPLPAVSCGTASHANEDVWYKFKATASKHVVTLSGVGGFKPVFEILSAAGTCSGSSMDCKSSSTGGATISLEKAGFSINQWYYLRVYNEGTEITKTPYFNVCVTTPPANDTCSGAISVAPDVACTPVNGDLARATPSYAAETYRDVWFKFIPKTPIHYIHINGGGDLKASIQLYTGACGSSLSAYNSIAAVKSVDSTITVAYSGLDTTKTYYYRVFHDNTSATASITAFTTCVENGILNDDCSGAYVLNPSEPGELCSETMGRVSGASLSTPGAGSLCGAANEANEDVWYKFQPTATKHYITLTGIKKFKPVVELLSSSGPCGGLTSLDCQSSSTEGASLTIEKTGLDTNKIYYLRIYNSGTEVTTSPYFNVCITTPPTNDDCTGATELFPSYTCDGVFGDGTYASKSTGLTACLGDPNDDLWYKFKADTTIHFISVNPALGYNPVVQVFSNCSTAFAPAFCNDASYTSGEFGTAAISGLVKDKTYYYRVYDQGATNPASMSFTTCVVNAAINDRCENAITINPTSTCNPSPGNGTYATESLPAGSCGGKANDDVWYKFTAQDSIQFISVNASLVYNPVVQVFKNCSTALPAPNAVCDDASFLAASLGTTKVSGLKKDSTYYYRVYDAAATNPITMTFTTCVTNPPVNDACAGAITVYPGSTCNPIKSNAIYASKSLAACAGSANDADDDVWFKFTAQGSSEFISVTPSDAAYDPVVQVFSNCLTAFPNAAGSCYDTYPTGQFGRTLITGLSNGVEYFYRVYDKSGATKQDTMTFTTCVVNVLTNDNCSGATSITPGITCNPIVGDGTYATQSLAGCSGNANDDVWFKFVADTSLLFISVTPNDNGYNPVVQVFSNCSTALNPAFCNDANYPVGSFGTASLSGLSIGATYYYRVYDSNTDNQDTMTFSTCVVKPVANDSCKRAISISPGSTCIPTIGDGTYATQSLAASCGGTANDDVWFKFQAQKTTEFISVNAPDGYDPVVQVFSNCPATASVFCEDGLYKKSSFGSATVSNLTVGSTYYYRVYDSNSSNTYPMAFTTCVVNSAENDSCGKAIQITPTSNCNAVSGDGTYASQSLTAGTCGGTANDDVWYKFTAASTSSYIYVTSSKDYDPVVEVYKTCSVSPASYKCDDARFPQDGTGSYSIPTDIGTTYYYRVYDKGSTIPSPMTFTTCVTTPPSPPINDEPCNALLITPTVSCSYATYTNEAATASVGPPAPGCAKYTGGDVWFKVKVPFSGRLTFDTKAMSILNGGMAIYKGKCSSLALIACNDDANGNMPTIKKQGLTPGDTIWVRVWEYENNNNGTFGICVTKPEEAVLTGLCNNLDFESGLAGWFGTTGYGGTTEGVMDGVSGASSPTYLPGNFNTTTPAKQFFMETSGIDRFGGFPKVYQGGKSLRLGYESNSNTGQSIEQFFPVSNSNATFIYNYAVVLQNGSHDPNMQPLFKAELFDDEGNQISCGDFLVAAPAAGQSDKIGFKKSPIDADVSYKAWTTVSVDLTPYIGKTVHARFITGSCADQSHFGYVYLDCACAPFEVINPGNICLGDSAMLYAPKGAMSYSWKDSLGNTLSTTDSLMVKPTAAGTYPYTCEVTMFGTSLCESKLETKVVVGGTPALVITDPDPVCQPATVNLTLDSVTIGSAPNLTYTYWKDNPPVTALTNKMAIDTSGTYFIKGEKGANCSNIKPVKVVINPLPKAKISGTTTVCKDSAQPKIIFTGSNGTPPYTFTYTINGGADSTIKSIGDTAKLTVPTSVAGSFNYKLVNVKDSSLAACEHVQNDSVKIIVNPNTVITIDCDNQTTTSVEFKWNNDALATGYNFSYNVISGTPKTENGTLIAGTSNYVVDSLNLNETVVFTLTPIGDNCSKTASDTCTTLNCNGAKVDTVAPIIVCSGAVVSAVNYTSTPVGATFKWINSDTIIGLDTNAIGNMPSFTAKNDSTAPKIATITVTADNGVCVGPKRKYTITVNPKGQVNDPANQVICNGDTSQSVNFTTLNTGGNTSYTWANDKPAIGLPASGFGNLPSFTTINNDSLPLFATITVSPYFKNGIDSCLGTTQTFTITVNPSAQVNTLQNKLVCGEDTIQTIVFSSKTTGGTSSYAWTNDKPGIGLAAAGVGNIPAFKALNAGTSSVVATISVSPYFKNGTDSCKGPSETFTITVKPSGQVNDPLDQVVCKGVPVQVNFTTSNTTDVITYTWKNDNDSIGLDTTGYGNILSFNTINNDTFPAVANLIVSPYLINGTDSCQGPSQNFTITVNPIGQVNVPANQEICSGDSAAAVVFSTKNTGGTTSYTWTNDNLGIGLAASGVGNILSFIAVNNGTANAVANINVTPYFKNGTDSCAGSSQAFKITVKPSGQLNDPANQVFCNKTTSLPVTFTTNNTVGTTSYTWVNDKPGIGLPANGFGNIPIFNTVNNDTFPSIATITVTPYLVNSSDSCKGASQTFTITVNPSGEVNIPSNKSVCSEDSIAAIVFSTKNTGGITSYSWTNDQPGIGLASAGLGNIPAFKIINNGISPVVSTITVVPYFKNGTDSCKGSARTFTITVNPNPTSSVTIANTSCNGYTDGSVIVGANGGLPVYKYSIDSINFQSQNLFDSLGKGNYTFTVKDQNGCKSKVDAQVSSPPPITFTVDPVTALICVGDSVTINALGYSSFNWFNQKTGNKIDSNITVIKVAPTSTTTYKVVSSICDIADSVKISVLEPILIEPISDKTICLGQTASFKVKATGGKGNFKYTWIPTPDFVSAIGDSASVAPLDTNRITYSLKAENDCKGYFIGFKLYINPLPVVDIKSINEICEGEKIDFENTAHQANYLSYNWDFNDGNKSADTARTSHVYTTEGNYIASLIVSDKNNCEKIDSSDLIIVNPVPEAVIYNTPSEDLNTNSVLFFTANRSIGNINKYEWAFGDSNSLYNIDTTFVFSDSGSYKVRLIVYNEHCIDTAFKTIEIVSDYGVFIPSAFTPNDDESNDYFMPKAFGIINYSMQIFNRWGELMFETNDLLKGWDGKKQTESAVSPEDVYVYKIKFTPLNKMGDKPIQKTGHFSLIK